MKKTLLIAVLPLLIGAVVGLTGCGPTGGGNPYTPELKVYVKTDPQVGDLSALVWGETSDGWSMIPHSQADPSFAVTIRDQLAAISTISLVYHASQGYSSN